MRDDSAIVPFVGFREGARHASSPSACYCIRETETVKSCMLVLVRWSDRAAAELTGAYDSFDEYLCRAEKMMKLQRSVLPHYSSA